MTVYQVIQVFKDTTTNKSQKLFHFAEWRVILVSTSFSYGLMQYDPTHCLRNQPSLTVRELGQVTACPAAPVNVY